MIGHAAWPLKALFPTVAGRDSKDISELLGRNASELIHPDDLALAREKYWGNAVEGTVHFAKRRGRDHVATCSERMLAGTARRPRPDDPDLTTGKRSRRRGGATPGTAGCQGRG